MKKAFLILLVTLGVLACKTLERTVEVEREVRVVERDTTVVIEADSASVRALFECDSLNRVIISRVQQQQGTRIVTEYKYITRSDGSMHVAFDCKEDSLRRVIAWQDSIITVKRTERVVEYVPRVSAYHRFCAWAWWILLALVLVRIALKLYFRI